MKKLGKFVFVLAALCIVLQGCGSKEYERDTEPGEVIKITLDEMDTMIVQGKTFPVMLTQSMCGYCQEFHALLKEYQKTHHLVMYEVVLDEEDATPDENLAVIEKHIQGFSTTPGIFYIKDGKQESHLKANAQGIDEELLEKWVVDNKLDEKK